MHGNIKSNSRFDKQLKGVACRTSSKAPLANLSMLGKKYYFSTGKYPEYNKHIKTGDR